MPKRKRTVEETVEEQLAKFGQELHHALKLAKGFERQRQAKRLKDSKATPEKKERLQKEIVVLKSLDLHQAAHAHLCASLLKIKSVAAAPNLPTELKAGPPKPDISEEERVALHNVTSALYNRKEVKQVLDKAVPAICSTLGLEAPSKKGKGPAKDARKEKEDQPADRESVPREEPKVEKKAKKPVKETLPDEIPEDEAEAAIAKYEALLGGSSEEDSGSEGDDEEDPMQITSDEGEDDDGYGDIDLDSEDGEEDSDDESSFGGFSSDEEEPVEVTGGAKLKVEQSVEDEDSDEEEDDDDSDHSSAISRSPSPKRTKRKRAVADTGPTTGSTFLPSLMGGYISGSESASDVDIEPPRKNRRGQRARQAIWEKKFKAEAKHLQKQTRDQGWDPKRGAVEGARTPWKKGIANPFSRPAEGGRQEAAAAAPPKKPRTTDNTGPLHPSWEAKKKAEEKQQNVKFEGKKIKFD
ncbi:Bud-site selection protein [Coniochaeta ligniaria NRRL 30616]|uniref:Bud-site selection protein n=1 Tax=Coniochaeta ligniaria NRRL 30616 TaxID=1408157 RepID=A0A1J7J5R7_9PEZI|nr:Bud-site selection protein [Coniochaeta ligniaria NRRL 30616]